MIQRIQTIFLLIASSALILSLFFPVWHKENPQTKEKVVLTVTYLTHTKADKVITQSSNIYIAGLAVASALLALYAVFMYANRIYQMRIVLFNTLLMCAVLGLMIMVNFQGEKLFAEPKHGEYDMGYFMPVIAIIMNYLARRFIKKDEELVRSADRMR
jgi:glucan phosphoethanolaminetransferase (alkaline phosphatase superfamily)